MRLFIKSIVLLAIAFSLASIPSLFNDFKELTGNAENWIGPDKGTDTLIHFFIIIAAFVYLILQTIPAFFGWILAADSRKAAFGLLLLPGFIGLIVAGAMFGLLYKFDPLWQETWKVSAIIGIPAVIYVIAGQLILQKGSPSE